MKRKRIYIYILVLITFFSSCSPKKDEVYPSKPINMVVPYGAGGTTDIIGRKFALALEEELGQKINIINQGGASGSIGSQKAKDAPSDGYTLLFSADSLGSQRVMGLSNLSYGDFAPIRVIADDPKVIVVSKESKYSSINELLEDIKNNPDKIRMSYTGPGGSGHVQAIIYEELGYKPALTAYDGGMDGILAVLGNQVDFTNSNYSTVAPYIDSGDLKILAVSSGKKIEKHSKLPLVKDLIDEKNEYFNLPFTPLSLLVNKNTDQEVIEKLRKASAKAILNKDFNKFMEDNSISKLYEDYTSIEEMEEFFKEWESKISWLLYDAGVAKYSPEEFSIKRR